MMSIFYWVLACIGFVGIDQLTKYLIINMFAENGNIPVTVIPDILEFSLTGNTGAGMGMLEGKRLLLIILPIVMMVVLCAFLYKTKKKTFILKATVMMIIAGGIGNLIDRIFRAGGEVIDFINVLFIDFYIFNVADIFVTVGGAILIIYIIFFAENEPSGAKKSEKMSETSEENE